MLIFRSLRSAEVQEFTRDFTWSRGLPLIKVGYYVVPDLSTTLLTGEKRTQGQSERPRG